MNKIQLIMSGLDEKNVVMRLKMAKLARRARKGKSHERGRARRLRRDAQRQAPQETAA